MPMILMGDEVRRTQRGNNNAYCQDNELSWFDWTLLEKHADVHRFVQLLCARRAMRAADHERQRLSLNQLIARATKSWHGVRLDHPDWSDHSHSIAITAHLRGEALLFHLMFNAYTQPLRFELPAGAGGRRVRWRRWIDTALDSPNDIVDWPRAAPVAGRTYHVEMPTW